MTRDDIIRMALEAGFQRDMFGRGIWDSEEFNRFHAIAIAAEREACAKVAEEATGAWTEYEFNSGCMYCAKAIRARGEV